MEVFFVEALAPLYVFNGASETKCSVLNKLTLLTYQYETKQEDG